MKPKLRFPSLTVSYIYLASSSDWFTVLFASVVTDQSNYLDGYQSLKVYVSNF